jgi:PAS domain-containing protein
LAHELVPTEGSEGTIVGINVVAEITENKRAEAAFAASEARYRALVRASSFGLTTAADGQIADMPEWRTPTGQTVDEVRDWVGSLSFIPMTVVVRRSLAGGG